MSSLNPFLGFELPKNLFINSNNGTDSQNNNTFNNIYQPPPALPGLSQQHQPSKPSMTDNELLQLLGGPPLINHNFGHNSHNLHSNTNNNNNNNHHNSIRNNNNNNNNGLGAYFGHHPSIDQSQQQFQQLHQQTEQAWINQNQFLQSQNNLRQNSGLFDTLQQQPSQGYSLDLKSPGTRNASGLASMPQNTHASTGFDSMSSNTNNNLHLSSLGGLQTSQLDSPHGLYTSHQAMSESSPSVQPPISDAIRRSLASPRSVSTAPEETQAQKTQLSWKVYEANSLAASKAQSAPPTDAVPKKKTANRAPSGSVKGKEKKKPNDKKPYIFDYWSHSKELRLYLAKFMSDEMIDDLEEMAKCIYEQQLEAMLPMDYKDMLYFEDVIVRMTRFHEVFLDSIVLPGVVYRRTGCILGMNEAFSEMIKRPRSELVDSNIVYYISPDDLFEAVKNFVLKLAFPGRPQSVIHDVCFLRPSNERVYARSHVHMQRNMHNMPAVFVAIFMPYAHNDWSIPHVGIID